MCNFRTLRSGLDSNMDNQYSQLKWFIVRDFTDWANEYPRSIHNVTPTRSSRSDTASYETHLAGH